MAAGMEAADWLNLGVGTSLGSTWMDGLGGTGLLPRKRKKNYYKSTDV